MQRCLILSARQFSFESERDNKTIDGVTVSYLDPACAEASSTSRGTFALNVSASLDLWPSLSGLPAVFDCEFHKRPGKAGRAVETLTSLSFVESVNIDKLLSLSKSAAPKSS